MKPRRLLPFALVVASLLLAACGAPSEAAIQTAIVQTQQIAELHELQTAVAAVDDSAEQPTATPAPPSDVWVSVDQNTNCRGGPGTQYALITTISAGQQAEVLMTYDDEYAVVRNPNGPGDCWLWLRNADESDFSQYALPIATQPPAPAIAAVGHTATVVAPAAATGAATSTVVPADTATSNPTPIADWSGSWTVKYYTANTTLQCSPVYSSGTLTGYTCILAGNQLPFATISSSQLRLNGSQGTQSWAVRMESNHNQFRGFHNSGGAVFELCGARNGYAIPTPCMP